MSEASQDYWIGFDLGGTKMLAVVFDDDFKEIGKARKKTKGNEGMEAGLKRINSTIEEALEDAKIKASQVKGLGIGCPGPLDLKKKTIRSAPNLGWENAPVGKSIEGEFGFPVAVANDVDAGVFGEYKFGAGKGARCVVGIFRGAIDGAGNHGSLESVAARLTIAGQCALAAYRGQAPNLLEKAGTDISEIRSGAISYAIEKGDKVVKEIVEDACEYLAMSVVTMVHLLAPDVIVFGGGMIEAMEDTMLPIIKKRAQKRILPAMRDVLA